MFQSDRPERAKLDERKKEKEQKVIVAYQIYICELLHWFVCQTYLLLPQLLFACLLGFDMNDPASGYDINAQCLMLSRYLTMINQRWGAVPVVWNSKQHNLQNGTKPPPLSFSQYHHLTSSLLVVSSSQLWFVRRKLVRDTAGADLFAYYFVCWPQLTNLCCMPVTPSL